MKLRHDKRQSLIDGLNYLLDRYVDPAAQQKYHGKSFHYVAIEVSAKLHDAIAILETAEHMRYYKR